MYWLVFIGWLAWVSPCKLVSIGWSMRVGQHRLAGVGWSMYVGQYRLVHVSVGWTEKVGQHRSDRIQQSDLMSHKHPKAQEWRLDTHIDRMLRTGSVGVPGAMHGPGHNSSVRPYAQGTSTCI